MVRLVVGVIATVTIVAFVMMNLHFVGVSLVFGTPVQVRLIFLLVAAFLVGLFSGFLMKVLQRTHQRRRAHDVMD